MVKLEMIVGNFLRADRSDTPPAEFANVSASWRSPLPCYWPPHISRHRQLLPAFSGYITNLLVQVIVLRWMGVLCIQRLLTDLAPSLNMPRTRVEVYRYWAQLC